MLRIYYIPDKDLSALHTVLNLISSPTFPGYCCYNTFAELYYRPGIVPNASQALAYFFFSVTLPGYLKQVLNRRQKQSVENIIVKTEHWPLGSQGCLFCCHVRCLTSVIPSLRNWAILCIWMGVNFCSEMLRIWPTNVLLPGDRVGYQVTSFSDINSSVASNCVWLRALHRLGTECIIFNLRCRWSIIKGLCAYLRIGVEEKTNEQFLVFIIIYFSLVDDAS